MKNRIRIGFAFVLAAGLLAGLGLGARELPELLAGIELFRVEEVRLEGARWLHREEAVAVLALPGDASVWDDFGAWEERLRGHELVEDAEIRRELPATLVLEVTEREPVALAPTPLLRPVDRRGEPVPLDPAVVPLDLPVIRPGGGPGAGSAGAGGPAVAALAGEVARIREAVPDFAARISEVAAGEGGMLVVWLHDPEVEVLLRRPVSRRRAREALLVLADAVTRRGGVIPETVDLRFADQVVVRYPRAAVRRSD